MTIANFWKDRFKASSVHFGISLVVALLAALLVFGLWYPYPYRYISGGRQLFFLVIAVDVILGPLITLAVFNRAKPLRELRRDLAVVVLIQLVALFYGLWTVFVARPVHMVFEYDRFRVVHAVDVPRELLRTAPHGVDALPIIGPTLLSLRAFRDGKEKMDATLAALQGVSLASRPDFWQPYEAGRTDILKEAQPLAQLKSRFPNQAAAIDSAVANSGFAADKLGYLPLLGRKDAWTVLIDSVNAQPVGYLPIDSF